MESIRMEWNWIEWNEMEIIGIIESNQIYPTDLLDPQWLILNLFISVKVHNTDSHVGKSM